MRFGYGTSAEAERDLTWNRAWELVDGTPEAINACEECLDRHSGPATAIQYSEGSTATHSYGELSDAAARFARLLDDIGLSADDRVAVMLDPSTAFLACFFGR